MRKGLSLVEMLVVLVLIAIVVGLAFSKHGVLLTKSREQVVSAGLLRSINAARSQAALLGVTVTLCKSLDGTTCSGRWEDGQIVFIDEDRNGLVSKKDRVIYAFKSQAGKGRLHWRSALNRDFLQFNSNGLAANENGTFWYCPAGSRTVAWAIVVNQAGDARLVYPDNYNKLDDLLC